MKTPESPWPQRLLDLQEKFLYPNRTQTWPDLFHALRQHEVLYGQWNVWLGPGREEEPQYADAWPVPPHMIEMKDGQPRLQICPGSDLMPSVPATLIKNDTP